jgi:hypothetical protein
MSSSQAPVASVEVAPITPSVTATGVAPTSRMPAIVTGSVALVAAGFGAAFGILALQQKSDFDKNPTQGSYHDGTEYAVIADACFGAAFALGVTSIALFVRGRDDVPPARSARSSFMPVPVVGAHMGGAALHVEF